MSENKFIRFIKPCRRPEEGHRKLTPEYAISLYEEKRIVQINLDNCSLQRMEQLPLKPTLRDVDEVGLLPLVQFLNNAPVALTAIGINEMPDWRVGGAKLAYERFCSNFWIGHKDDIEATNKAYDRTMTERKVEFFELAEKSRSTYGMAYVALLQMQNIHRTYPSMNPEEKFEAYLHGIVEMLDIISAFELEIAKYAFWDLSFNEISLLPESIRFRRKDIKENFTKLQSSVTKCKQFSFSGAMDLYWLSGANLSEDLGLTLKTDRYELTVDNWVGTNDIKLYRISKDIHSVPSEGSTMKALAYARESELQASSYWRNVDQIANAVLQYRKRAKYRETNQLLGRIDSAVSHIEKQLLRVLPE